MPPRPAECSFLPAARSHPGQRDRRDHAPGVSQSTELDYTLGPVVLQGVTIP
jgi:hypothetical protein